MVHMGSFDEKIPFVLHLGFCVCRKLNAGISLLKGFTSSPLYISWRKILNEGVTQWIIRSVKVHVNKTLIL